MSEQLPSAPADAVNSLEAALSALNGVADLLAAARADARLDADNLYFLLDAVSDKLAAGIERLK